MVDFCIRLGNSFFAANGELSIGGHSSAVLSKHGKNGNENLGMFRYDLDIEHATVDLLRIFGFYNHQKCNVSLSLSLGMKPPRKERIKFKQRLSCLCQAERLDGEEYFCSLKKCYSSLEQLTSSDIQAHTEELSGLYQSMKRIREQLNRAMKENTAVRFCEASARDIPTTSAVPDRLERQAEPE